MNKNWPNRITSMRFVLAIVIFFLLAQVKDPKSATVIFDWGLILFFIAGISDFFDGYLARKYNLESAFGRIADPFVDKFVIGGTFIFFIQLTDLIAPWMVVLIIGREFLISSVRGYAESQGMAFPANMWGKVKATWQFLTLGYMFIHMGRFQDAAPSQYFALFMIWGTIIITVLSTYSYIVKAVDFFENLEEKKEESE